MSNAQDASSQPLLQPGLSSFALKIIAIFGMACNHAAYIFYFHTPFPLTVCLFSLGGITFPVMAFLLVEGYHHTSNVKKYALRLLLFALISEIPFWLFLAHEGNVLFTLLIGLAILYLYDHLENRGVFWLTFAALTGLSALCDWGILGPVMILMMRVLPDRRKRIIYPLLLPIISQGIPHALTMISTLSLTPLPFALYALIGCTLAIPLLLSYNGLRGRPLKYFFYVFYPLHILLLGLAKGLLLGDWSLGA